jgi:hypothetical protein
MNTYTTTSPSNLGSTITITGGGSGYTGAGVTLNTGAGVAGSVLTAGNYTGATVTSSYNWSNPNPNSKFSSSNHKTIMTIPHGEEKMVLEKDATLEVKGNVVINGVDLEERLNVIEKVLQIPNRDVTMEAKHPKLAELYNQYMHELEKYRTWDRLNGEENGTT